MKVLEMEFKIKIEKHARWKTEGGQPCPVCGESPANGCTYLEYNYWNGDYDCVHPYSYSREMECNGCIELTCTECRERAECCEFFCHEPLGVDYECLSTEKNERNCEKCVAYYAFKKDIRFNDDEEET